VILEQYCSQRILLATAQYQDCSTVSEEQQEGATFNAKNNTQRLLLASSSLPAWMLAAVHAQTFSDALESEKSCRFFVCVVSTGWNSVLIFDQFESNHTSTTPPLHLLPPPFPFLYWSTNTKCLPIEGSGFLLLNFERRIFSLVAGRGSRGHSLGW
jgi:hypothetical protein